MTPAEEMKTKCMQAIRGRVPLAFGHPLMGEDVTIERVLNEIIKDVENIELDGSVHVDVLTEAEFARRTHMPAHPEEDAFQAPQQPAFEDREAEEPQCKVLAPNCTADQPHAGRVAPDTNPKTQIGIRKPGVRAIPPVSLLHLGAAMENGCEKYGLTNWREHAVSASVYYEAAQRHMMAWWDGEQVADDSKVHHLGHVMACCAILLDAEAQGCLNDDRPAIPGKFSEMVAAMIDSFPEGVG